MDNSEHGKEFGPPMSNDDIAQFMRDHGLTAPSVSSAGITAKIASVVYMIVPESVVTVCAITLRNGFVFLGKSDPVSPDNFNKDLGRKISYDDAFRQIWSHEGYLLKEVLHQAKLQGLQGDLEVRDGGINVRLAKGSGVDHAATADADGDRDLQAENGNPPLHTRRED